MKLTLLFLCCILVKGLVANTDTEIDLQSCAPYVVARTNGSGYEDAGIPSDGSPVIFKLQLNRTGHSSGVHNVYRNEFGGCMYIEYNQIYIESNCPESPAYFNYDFVNYVNDVDVVCFPYAYNNALTESEQLTDGNIDDMTFTTPEAPCSDCRTITARGAGSLGGSYTLQEHFNFGCGADTDGCAYEKDGETYCFQENGLYGVDFNCPAL